MDTYKPQLIIISINELIKHIKVKATSASPCSLSYYDEMACGVWADAHDAPDMGHPCVDVGPLFGCDNDSEWYCSNIIPILR